MIVSGRHTGLKRTGAISPVFKFLTATALLGLLLLEGFRECDCNGFDATVIGARLAINFFSNCAPLGVVVVALVPILAFLTRAMR